MALPCHRTSPELGLSRPASRPRSVDLPEPDAPMIATNSPRSIVKSKPRRISTVVEPVRRLLRNLSTTMIGLESVTEFGEPAVETKGEPLGKIKAVIRRYGLRFDSVLILAAFVVLAGCSTAA